MKNLCVACLLVMSSAAGAQSSSAKQELIAKFLLLQQGAIEQTAQGLVERPALQMMQQASVALQTQVPPDKREQIGKAIQAEVKKYADETGPLVRQQAVKLAPSTIGALMEQRFTEDELKQLIAIIESPVNRKFLQMAGDLQKALTDKVVSASKSSVEPKMKALEQAIVKHLGLPSTPAVKPVKGSSK